MVQICRGTVESVVLDALAVPFCVGILPWIGGFRSRLPAERPGRGLSRLAAQSLELLGDSGQAAFVAGVTSDLEVVEMGEGAETPGYPVVGYDEFVAHVGRLFHGDAASMLCSLLWPSVGEPLMSPEPVSGCR